MEPPQETRAAQLAKAHALLDKVRGLEREFTSKVAECVQSLEASSSALEQEMTTWQAQASRLHASQLPHRIRFDVGGTIFALSREHLTSEAARGSYFDAMFSGRWPLNAESDGTYFIDRDPFVFRHVANYLRREVLNLELLSRAELEALKKDAAFYQLDGLLRQLPPFDEPCPKAGDVVDALDKFGRWYVAEIKAELAEDTLHVHFMGWPEIYDEMISKKEVGKRIMRRGTHTGGEPGEPGRDDITCHWDTVPMLSLLNGD